MAPSLPLEVAHKLRQLGFHSSASQGGWYALIKLLVSANTLWATAVDTVWVESSAEVGQPPAALLMVKTTVGICGLTVEGEWAHFSSWLKEHPQARPETPAECLKVWARATPDLIKTIRHTGYTLSSSGIGLTFVLGANLPLDQAAFEGLLISYSCHPKFARRIFQDLREHGSRSTTVVSCFHEQLPAMTVLFASFGVMLTRTWPYPRPIPTSAEPYPDPMPNKNACVETLRGAYQASIRGKKLLSV